MERDKHVRTEVVCVKKSSCRKYNNGNKELDRLVITTNQTHEENNKKLEGKEIEVFQIDTHKEIKNENIQESERGMVKGFNINIIEVIKEEKREGNKSNI